MKKNFLLLKSLLVLLLIGLALISGFTSDLIVTTGDSLILIFAGGSQVTFQLKSFLAYFFIYMTFIYLLQVQLQKKINETGYYQLIRYKSTNKWIFQWFKKVCTGIVVYLIFLFISAVGISFLFNQGLDFTVTIQDGVTFYQIIYHFFVNGFLQLVVYILFIFIVSWWSKEVFHSLVGIVLILLFMFPNMNSFLYIPSGLNSMFYILEGNSIYKISIILFVWGTIGIWIANYLLKRDLKL